MKLSAVSAPADEPGCWITSSLSGTFQETQSRPIMNSMNDDGRIARVLAEAIAWCAARSAGEGPATNLRSPALRPPNLSGGGAGGAATSGTWQWGSVAERQHAVTTVTDRRSAHLRRENSYPPVPSHDLAGGRLLVYAPDEGLADGAAALASRGFFDEDNAPP